MKRRLAAIACITVFGLPMACSSTSSEPEQAASTNQALTFDPVLREPDRLPFCFRTSPPAANANCGAYHYPSTCSVATTLPNCPDDEFCGGVPDLGTANVCGNPLPPGCNALPASSTLGACQGTCDIDPASGQPFAQCSLSQTTDYLVAAKPYLVEAEPNTTPGADALPCSVWEYVEEDPGSIDTNDEHHHKYMLAYCQNGGEPDGGTVMDDWVYNVNAYAPTHFGWYPPPDDAGTDEDAGGWSGWVLYDDPNEQIAGSSLPGAVPDGTPYNAQTTSKPRVFGEAAPGYIWVEFMVNSREPNGCSGNSGDTGGTMPCIVLKLADPLPIGLGSVESDPTAIPSGGGY